jgi:signal peptidase I
VEFARFFSAIALNFGHYMDGEDAPPSTSENAWRQFVFGRDPRWTLARIIIACVTTLLVFKFWLLPIRVTGESMFPTCINGEVKLVNRLAYLHHTPKRGDIIAVEFQGRDVLLLKRIVGLPGEVFQVRNGYIFVNGKKLDEPYVNGRILGPNNRGYGSSEPIPLGPTEYMVLGDNRHVSEGYIKDADQIVGKVL